MFTARFYRRISASVPLLVTVILHAVLFAAAGFWIVSEQIVRKKNIMTAAPPADATFQKQVEHRLQIARKGGGSSSPSPVSASRIFSTAQNALQMPAMPELPAVGASSLSGMGFGAGMGGAGPGSGYQTGLGMAGSGGRGFMSLSFLGMTNQKASRIVFVVDVGTSLLDIRKGGFEAFAIIRAEMMKLISRLPPGAEFGVVVFDTNVDGFTGTLAAFDRVLLPATVANKQRLFDWMSLVNANPDKVGMSSVNDRIPWKPKALGADVIKPEILPPHWANALHWSLEMEPDIVYVITGSAGSVLRKINEAELEKRKKEHEERLAALKRDGLDPEAINSARTAFLKRARARLDQVNARLKAQGKPPFIIQAPQRIFDPDFQAALKRAGESIPLDATGWSDKQGRPIWWVNFHDRATVDYSELLSRVSLLQRALLKERAVLNVFLFVGPDEKAEAAGENLGKLANRSGGKFELITTRRLKELSARAE